MTTLPEGWQLADDELPPGWTLPTEQSPLKGFAQSAVKGLGAIAKGAEAVAYELPPVGDFSGGQPAPEQARAYQEQLAKPASQKLQEIESGPLYEWGKAMQDAAEEVYPLSDEEKRGFVTKAGEMAGGFLPLVTSGPAAPVTMGLQAAGENLEQEFQRRLAAGASHEEAANAAINRSMADGAVQAALFEVLPAPLKKLGDKAIDQVARGTLSRFLAGRVAQAGEGAAMGAASQAASNVALDHPLGEGTRESATGLGVMQALLPRGATTPTDTGKNVPESEPTLLAQQQQLVDGRRPAQMFPVDATGKVTNELPVPDGMERTTTDRGVFHFNPELTTAKDIQALSAEGRENEVLGLGKLSKPEVDEHAANGAQRVAITERTPDGTEVKTAVGTDDTAAATAADLERAKTPGNTVQVEPLDTAAQSRARSGFVDDLLAQDVQKQRDARDALAREQVEREARQQDLAAKRASFDERVQTARQTYADPNATPAQVKGALESMKFYAEDNSLGLSADQRQTANRALASLTQRYEPLRIAEETRIANEAKFRSDQAAQLAADQAAQRTAAKTDFKSDVAAGISATGGLDYTKLPEDRLTELAQNGDAQAGQQLMRRGDMQGIGIQGESLLDALAKVKLPTQSDSLPGELAALHEEMTPQQRRKLVKPGKVDLDSIAEVLRADHGFSQIKTPADVIDYVQRALRGEDVRADWAGGQVREGVDSYAKPAQVYVRENGTPPQKTAEAEQHVARVLRTADDKQLDLFTYPLPETATPTGEVGAGLRAGQDLPAGWKLTQKQEIAGALTQPTNPEALKAGFSHGDRISSIIPELVRSPQQGWDIRGAVIKSARDFATLLQVLRTPYVETVKFAFLNGRQEVVHSEIVTIGSIRAAFLDPSQIAQAMRRAPNRAKGLSLIIAHNHPSGNPTPSAADVNVTRQLDSAAREAGIPLVDHVITNGDTYYSFRESGQMMTPRSDIRPSSKKPAVRGVDVSAGRELGELAPWENVKRAELSPMDKTDFGVRVMAALRQVNPDATHVLYLNNKGQIAAIERLPAAIKVQDLKAHIFRTSGEEGATAFMVDAPASLPIGEARILFYELGRFAKNTELPLADFSSSSWLGDKTARQEMLLMEDSNRSGEDPTVQQARNEVQRIESELARLRDGASQEEPADVEARGAELTAQLEAARYQLTKAEREAQAAASVRPASTLRGAEPETLPRTPEDLAKGVTRVAPLPPFDRRAALLSELQRGRDLAREGNTTGNDAALAEGTRLTKLARERLDEEFPGWEKPAGPSRESLIASLREAERLERAEVMGAESWVKEYRNQLDKQFPGWEKPAASAGGEPPHEPPITTEGANAGDSEPSPFSGGEENTMPVRPGKFDEVYGQNAAHPSALAKTWKSLSDMFRGFKGTVPELPTFPAAWWNQADKFIQQHGPQFYNGVKEFVKQIHGGDGFVRRTADESVGGIVAPLLKAGGKFNADDYARLQQRQEQARLLQAEEKPIPPGVRAEIAALNSKLESSPYVLFERLVLALDLNWRQQNLTNSNGDPVRLPGGVNAAELKAELARLSQRIEASPYAALIKNALQQHMALVKNVADDLKGRELLATDELRNPYYFPHLTLVTAEGKPRELRISHVHSALESPFRGYLIEPEGSTKPIATDYAQAMFYHLVQVTSHNLHADAVARVKRTYDITAEVEARAKELSRQRGQPVSVQQAFHEEFAKKGYVRMGVDDANPFGVITVDRDLLAKRLGVMLTSDDLHQQLAGLGLKGIKILPEDLRETFIDAHKEVWIVPAKVSEALKAVARRDEKATAATADALTKMNSLWKWNKLFSPTAHIRYEFNNTSTDVMKLLATNFSTFRELPGAAKELREFWLGGAPSDDLRAALKYGVLDTITAGEVAKLAKTTTFRDFETSSQKALNEAKAWITAPEANVLRLTPWKGIGRVTSTEESMYREGVFRYGNFKASLNALRAGARPEYGGAYWKDIEGITDSAPGANDRAIRQAAQISKSTLGDYGDISVSGQWLRQKLIQFYSWQELQFRYTANALRNMRDMVRAGEISTTEGASGTAKALAAASAGFGARVAGGVALRLSLAYVAAALWNNNDENRKLEDLLSDEDRRRFHIVLGEKNDGNTTLRDGRRVQVMYLNTALDTVAAWFSGQAFAQNFMDWQRGRTDFSTAFQKWAKQVGPDFLQKTVGAAGPVIKIPYMLLAKKDPTQDITDQRSIPAYDMRRAILGEATDNFTASQIERIVNKDYYGTRDLGSWAKQIVLQVRERDPEQWAFYDVKDKAQKYLEKMTNIKDTSGYDAPDQQVLRNFRRAIFLGDVENATRFYLRLLDYGYTKEKFAGSIRAQDPLDGLPNTVAKPLRQQFVASLSDTDKEELTRAYQFYERLNVERGSEAGMFPPERSGVRGQQLFQNSPHTQQIDRMMQRAAALSDEELLRRAALDLRRGLVPRP